MRTIKLFGLAVLAALAVAAFVGASSASALTLCKSNTNPCPAGERYPSETELKGTGVSELTAIGALIPVECTEAVTKGKTLAESAGLLPVKISFTFASCTYGLTACTMEASGQPYEAGIYEPNGGNGKLATEGNPVKLTVVCGSTTCIYSAGVKFPITGGNPWAMATTNWPLERQTGSSEVCVATAEWTVSYTMGPAPLFVQESP